MYSYYAFLDKFHTEPRSWRDFFVHMEFNRVDSEISASIADVKKKE